MKEEASACAAFHAAMEVLSLPWNALVLNLLQEGPRRFSELSGYPDGPGDKVLSARLKDLEACGLIVREVEAGPPVRVSYSLTKQGKAFGSVAKSIEAWGRTLVGNR